MSTLEEVEASHLPVVPYGKGEQLVNNFFFFEIPLVSKVQLSFLIAIVSS